MEVISDEVAKRLLAFKTADAFKKFAIKNITGIPVLNDLPKEVLEHYYKLCEEDYAECRKDPNYEVSPYSHGDPREAFEKRIYKSKDEDNG